MGVPERADGQDSLGVVIGGSGNGEQIADVILSHLGKPDSLKSIVPTTSERFHARNSAGRSAPCLTRRVRPCARGGFPVYSIARAPLAADTTEGCEGEQYTFDAHQAHHPDAEREGEDRAQRAAQAAQHRGVERGGAAGPRVCGSPWRAAPG